MVLPLNLTLNHYDCGRIIGVVGQAEMDTPTAKQSRGSAGDNNIRPRPLVVAHLNLPPRYHPAQPRPQRLRERLLCRKPGGIRGVLVRQRFAERDLGFSVDAAAKPLWTPLQRLSDSLDLHQVNSDAEYRQ